MADSSTNRFGLIGNPVSGSKSPVLFKAAYGGKYPYDLIEEPDFETAWHRFLGTESVQTGDGGNSGYTAINVTAPFKEMAFAKVLEAAREGRGSIDGPCFKIGATNLVVRRPGSEPVETGEHEASSPVGTEQRPGSEPKPFLEAHNSDFTGVVLSVAEALFPGITDEFYREFGSRAPIKIHQFVRQQIDNVYPRGPQALIVGCGGAGRAAAVAAAELGFATALMNRTLEKAQSLAQERPEYGFLPVPLSDFRGAVRECDLVIYTLPMRLDEIDRLTVEDFAGEDRDTYRRPAKIILEANYKTPAFAPVTAAPAGAPDEHIPDFPAKKGPLSGAAKAQTGTAKERMLAAGCQYVSGERWLKAQAITGYALMTGQAPDIAAVFNADITQGADIKKGTDIKQDADLSSKQ